VSEWNLSVRLTGQGTSLRTMLRGVSGDARTASRDVNQLRDDIHRLRLEARSPIKVRVSVDADRLRDDVRAALRTAGGEDLTVGLRLSDTMQLRREVAAAVRWAGWGHRIEIPLVLADRMQLRRDVSDAVRWASTGQTIRVRVTPDTSALTGLTRTLGAGGGGGGGAGMGLQGLLMLAPAAIPLLAGLSSTVAPLAGQFALAGAAAGVFTVALAGQIDALSEVADAEKKYQEAVREHGKASAEAITAQIKYQQQLTELPPDAQKAAIALSQLKTTFSDWSDDMSGFTMQPLTKGITILDTLIPHLTPQVEAFSGHMDRLMNVAGGAISTPGFDAFSERVADLTDAQLDSFTDQLIHLLRIVSEGDADSGAIGQILDYMRENGPAAREAVDALGDAIGTLAEGAADAGPTMLTIVTAAARLVAALPPELVTIVIQLATALKLLQLAGVGIAATAVAATRVRTAIAGLAAVSAAAGGGLAGLAAAFATLGVAARASIIVAGIAAIAIVLKELSDIGKQAPPDVDKLTGSLAKLGQTGKVSGEAARAFGSDFAGLAESLRTLSRPSNLDKTQQFLTSMVGMDSTPVKEAKQDLNALDEALANLVKGGKGDLAAAAFERIADAMRKQGMSEKELRSQLGDYKSALADVKFEQELAAQSMGLFGQAALETQAKLDAQKASADGLRQSILALNEVNRAAGSAMSAFEQAIDDATAAAQNHSGALRMTNGDLDLGSQSARDAEKVLSDLAADTDAAATAAREQGRSWEYVQGIMSRGQQTFVDTAVKMGLTKTQAQALAQSYLDIPDSKATTVEMQAEDATRDLEAFNEAVRNSPGSKSVTLTTLSAAAERILEAFGYKVTRLPDGSVTVSASTGAALAGVQNVAGAVAALKDKTIYLTTVKHTVFTTTGTPGKVDPVHRDYADGGVVDYYANGGIQRGGVRRFAGGAENHVAQIAPAGSWRVWGEPETGGEGYVPFAMSKRPRSRAITEEIVRRLGGDPAGIQWNAQGNVTDWTYDPQTGSLYSSSQIGSAGNKTRKVKVKGKDGKVTIKEIEYFDLGAVEKKLKSASKATLAWNKDLEKVADRVGGDVAEALAAMGEEGMKLADKMANGSTKYINEMAAALRNLQKTAKASLTDYTRQLTSANKVNKDFAADLAVLAGMGYEDLAAQLAAQGDEAAQQLADSAAKDPKKAKKADAAAKNANNALTGDQIADLIQIIAAISNSKVGIHDVAAKTGIGEDVIIEIANKAKGEIHKALGSKASRFFSDLKKANSYQAYADGGIRAGMYATSNGIIRFAEPSTHGEAYLPLSPTKRRSALPVLADVARRFGVGLTDVQAGRSVVIVRSGDTINVPVTPVRTGATASDIGAQVGRSVRRARRGGVAARAY
jgi:hypothetical protein